MSTVRTVARMPKVEWQFSSVMELLKVRPDMKYDQVEVMARQEWPSSIHIEPALAVQRRLSGDATRRV